MDHTRAPWHRLVGAWSTDVDEDLEAFTQYASPAHCPAAVAAGVSEKHQEELHRLLSTLGFTADAATHLADSLAMWHTSVGDGKEGVAAFLEKRKPKFKVRGYTRCRRCGRAVAGTVTRSTRRDRTTR